jgi:hypothetical protein
MYEHEHRNMAPINAIVEHWGYKPGSGNANVTVAALSKFGLLEAEGTGVNRHARLTDLALKILLDVREDSPERLDAIRAAALEPSIHKEILAKYPDGLPSDTTMIYYLTMERHFTDGAARELVPELRGTLRFASLTGASDTVDGQDEDKGDQEVHDMTGAVVTPDQTGPPGSQRRKPPPPQTRSVQLPVPGTSWVTLEGAFPLSEQAWGQMLALLEAMKPGLTTPDE